MARWMFAAALTLAAAGYAAPAQAACGCHAEPSCCAPSACTAEPSCCAPSDCTACAPSCAAPAECAPACGSCHHRHCCQPKKEGCLKRMWKAEQRKNAWLKRTFLGWM